MRINFKNKNFFVFDMDGTLAPNRSMPIVTENKKILQEILNRKKSLIILSSGGCQRLLNQLNQNGKLLGDFIIMANYGLDIAQVENGEIVNFQNTSYKSSLDLIQIDDIIEKIILKNSLPVTAEKVIFFDSGLIVFPMLGDTHTDLERNNFDPHKSKRLIIVKQLKSQLPDFNYFISGRTSIDILKKGYNKYSALLNFCKARQIPFNEVVFFGDEFDTFGNDRSIKDGYLMDKLIDYCQIKNAHLPKNLSIF